MVPTVDIAPALFHQLVDVKRSMQQLQLSPSKTEEVITAYILNQWWAEQGLPYSIAIATPPTGYDGLLKVNGQVPEGQTMAVEFKAHRKRAMATAVSSSIQIPPSLSLPTTPALPARSLSKDGQSAFLWHWHHLESAAACRPCSRCC